MSTSYDEELTPAVDPPLIEPPPPATLMGRIFAHRRPPRTVVEAPLVAARRRAGDAPAPDARPGPPAGAGPAVVPEPRPEPPAEPSTVAPPAVAPPPAEPPAEPLSVAPPPAATATRETGEIGKTDAPPAVRPDADPDADDGADEAGPPPQPAPPAALLTVATRYCPACADRVPVAADGEHCARGHRISPAHALPRSRGWRFWRRRR